jgi:Secretion system C-terminal sorting domain
MYVSIHYFNKLRRKEMKATRLLFCLMFVLFVVAGISSATPTTISAAGDTMYITGGTLAGLENAGALETAINGDTTAAGARVNPNRVYALYEGQYYVQQNALDVINPTGTLSIVGVKSASGHTKPVWMMQGLTGPILINGGGCNVVYGSLNFQNIHYVGQQLDGTLQNENFYCGTQNKLPQSLTINNCLFEFSNIDIFDCTNESGAIGGWPYGAKFKITNSYFRNLFYNNQWWGSRVLQCKHPIDTLWVENVATTGGGLTFLQQNELTDFAYFNHNTIVNNHKYWILSPYYKTLVVTNNIFLNQNWVGEDSTVTNSGQDPDKYFTSTIYLDSISYDKRVMVQPKYWATADSTSYVSALDINKLKVFISNNVNYWNPLLLNYFTNAGNITGDSTTGYVNSWLDWGYGFKLPQRINNMPCEWMNSHTQALFTAYAPPNGGFVADAPLTVSPGSPTIDNIDAATRNIMMAWNQNKWADPHFPTAPDALHSKMIFGDFDPKTVPGIAGTSGGITYPGSENGIGITKFTDLTENWNATLMSTIDNLPLGALIWNDAQLSAFNSAVDYADVNAAYMAEKGVTIAVKPIVDAPNEFTLLQNYPNPFNPTTNINFTLAKASKVKLTVYDVLGQKVMTLVDRRMSAGNQSIVFDASKLTSGVYFYRLDAGSFSSVKKMMLLK